MAAVTAGWFSVGCYRLLASTDAASAEAKSTDPAGPPLDAERIFDCVRTDPPRRVWLSSFEIDRLEVTRGAYQKCVDAGACERVPPPQWEKYHRALDLPALATYEDAEKFCKWRGKRLPTNAEWEKSARGIDDRIYPWGDTPPTCNQVDRVERTRDGMAIFNDTIHCNPGSTPHAGAQHPSGASPSRVEDLIDNASEWVSDWYVDHLAAPRENRFGLDEKLQPITGSESFSFSRNTSGTHPVLEYDWNSLQWAWLDPAVVDPQGPQEPTGPGVHTHAIKGTPLGFGISGTDRHGDTTDDTGRQYAGFRCARSIAGPTAPKVQSPASGEFALPFRETGYSAPGTTTQPAAKTRPDKAARVTSPIRTRKTL